MAETCPLVVATEVGGSSVKYAPGFGEDAIMSSVLQVRRGVRWMYFDMLRWASVIDVGMRGGQVKWSAMVAFAEHKASTDAAILFKSILREVEVRRQSRSW